MLLLGFFLQMFIKISESRDTTDIRHDSAHGIQESEVIIDQLMTLDKKGKLYTVFSCHISFT